MPGHDAVGPIEYPLDGPGPVLERIKGHVAGADDRFLGIFDCISGDDHRTAIIRRKLDCVASGRVTGRRKEAEAPISEETTGAQAKALVTWGSMPDNYAALGRITQPVLIVNGSNDLIAPTLESVVLFQHIPSAQLSLYPDSGHGSLFQYHALFVSQANTFLDASK